MVLIRESSFQYCCLCFLSMHRQCIRLAIKDEHLRNCYKVSDLEDSYLFLTLDDRITEQVFSESHESIQA